MNILSLPKKSILYLIICAAGLLAIFMVTFFSNYLVLNQLDRKIDELNNKIEGQKLYAPVFQELFKRIQSEPPQGISFQKQTGAARASAGNTLSVMRELALANNLKIEALAPDVDSSVDGSTHLMVNMVLQGNFPELQAFLLQLNRVPDIAHVEQVELKAIEERRELRLHLWMAKE